MSSRRAGSLLHGCCTRFMARSVARGGAQGARDDGPGSGLVGIQPSSKSLGKGVRKGRVYGKGAARHRLRTWPAVLCGAGAGVFVLVLYLKTLAPGVLYYARPELMDAATLQVHAAKLGITHPTGYPTWVMVTHLFTRLPVADAAFAVNLASAVYGAIAVSAVFLVCYLLSGRQVPAAAGALAFGTGRTFWGSAVIPDVYTLNALFVAAIVALLLLWRARRRDRYLLLASLAMGLSLTNHLTSGLLLPAGLLFVWLVDHKKLSDTRLARRAAGLFVIGLTPYVYLPIRASMDPPLAEADPTTIASFFTHVSGTEVNRTLLSFAPLQITGRFASHLTNLYAEFGWILLVAAAFGLYMMLKRDRAAAALTAFLALGWLLHALFYNIYDIHLYLIPVYLMVSLWIAAGTACLLREVEAMVGCRWTGDKAVPILFCTLLLAVPLTSVPQTVAQVNRSDDQRGREIIETVAEKTEPRATVLHNRSSLWYMVLVEERRRDLTFLDPFRPATISTRDLVWPADLTPKQAARRYGTYDNTGVAAARKAARAGPVYILDQQSAHPGRFFAAGFTVVEVEEGVLYRLEPMYPSGDTS